MFHCPHQELIICFIWNRFSYFQLCMQCHLSIPFEIKDATTLEMGVRRVKGTCTQIMKLNRVSSKHRFKLSI